MWNINVFYGMISWRVINVYKFGLPCVFSSVILDKSEIFATQKNGNPKTIRRVPTMIVGKILAWTVNKCKNTELMLSVWIWKEGKRMRNWMR
jgi:hypothetical protein